MAKYLLMIWEKDYSPTTTEIDYNSVMQQHEDFGKAVAASGATVVGGEALQPSSTATFFRGTRTADVHVIDNPLPDLKEVLGGYYLIEAEDDAAAAELAKLCPAPMGYIEVRPIWVF